MIQTEDFIIQLSDNMVNSKKDLLAYINCFHYTNSQEYEDAKFLIQSQDDLNKWIELWDGNPDEIYEANCRLRKWKIKEHLVSEDEFVDMMLLDDKDCLETVFQHRVGNRMMIEIEEVLGEDLTIEMLYWRHVENLESRVEYLI